jgi:acyl-coenzyme A synthetase/AMP-(fatty) acid ligase
MQCIVVRREENAMSGYAALPDFEILNGRELDGLIVNDKFISYYQVESALYNYPKVLEAGVIVNIQDGESVILKVYLALEDSFSAKKEREQYCSAVEQYIRNSFSFKMPIWVLIREKLPMTRSGKILRSVLRDY